MNDEELLTKEQARALAAALYPELIEYVKARREENAHSEQALQKGGESP